MASSLTIDGGNLLTLTNGSLALGSLTNSGATVQLANGSIIGGSLTNGGAIDTTFGYFNNALGGAVTNKSGATIAINNYSALTLASGATLSNAGTIALNSTGNPAELVINTSNLTLGGGGVVTMSNNGNNYIYGGTSTDTLTNQETIQGAGNIGDGQMTLVNAGTIDANQPTALTIQANGGTTNTGLLEATSGGTLGFSGTTVANTSGTINTGGGTFTANNSTINGGTVTLGTGGGALTNSTINGATVTSPNGAAVQLANGAIIGGSLTNGGAIDTTSGYFNNALGGAVTNKAGATVAINNYSALTLASGAALSNAGTIALNSTGNPAELVINTSNLTLGGGGVVTMSNNGNNYIYGGTSTDTLTNQEKIQGAGNIGNGQMTLVNAGTIDANQPTPLNIQANGGFTNNGALSVSGASLMHVYGGAFSNFSGGTLTGGAYNVGGTLEIDQLGNSGGEITTNSANIALAGSGSSFVDAAGKNALSNLAANTATGIFGISGGRNFTTAGNFTNNGALTVGAGSAFTVNGNLTNFSGTTLTGGVYNVSGTLAFNGANIVANAANLTLNGTSSQILNQSGGNGLANFASNAANGVFSLQGGRTFATASSFSNAGIFTIGTGSSFTVGGTGSFTQTGGTTTDDGTLTLPASGKLNLNNGSLFGLGTITGAVASSGSVTPGNSATSTGVLSESGAYAQNSSGSLNIEISGTKAGTQYDQLNPTTASLNGALNISLSNGFVPTVGSTFKIMNFNSVTGTFVKVNGLTINPSEYFTITYQPTDVLLTVVSGAAPAAAGGTRASVSRIGSQGYGTLNFASVQKPSVQVPNAIATMIPSAPYKMPVFAQAPATTGHAIREIGSLPVSPRSTGQGRGVMQNKLLSYNVNVLSLFGRNRVAAFRNSLTQIGDVSSPSLFSLGFSGSH